MLEIITGLVLLAFALFVPGYFLTLAVFPRRADADALERAAFSVVFSISFLPLFILIENQVFGIAIDFVSVVSTVLLLIIIGIIVWLIRTARLPVPAPVYWIFTKVPANEAVPLLPWQK